jgi:hypothetical protein
MIYELLVKIKDVCVEIIIPFGITMLVIRASSYFHAKSGLYYDLSSLVQALNNSIKDDNKNKEEPGTVIKFGVQKGGKNDE